MPRARSNVPRLKRKKQIMKAARGAYGGRSKLWKAAKENVERGWRYAYRDRKNRKREFRRLWIVRINAAARQNDMSYNVFMNGLKQAGIEPERLRLEWISAAEGDRVRVVVNEMTESIRRLGPLHPAPAEVT